ncbi:MAG: hypothetical protein NTW02_08915 [Cyanobium sp. LacPavin_0920_WC12_MAG_62_9]|nr:hypothetical protein [Cyanobium sp. LacPavin_0920_WC12_MAG_62_9]
MKVAAPFSNQEVVAVTGKLVVASRSELADLLAQCGHKYVLPDYSTFSVLVVACDPSGADIVKAKSMDATILTERQFLDQLPAPELIERAQAEACNPTTSKKRLRQLAAVVPEAAAQNPIWQILHLENPDFLDKEDGVLKLRLLRLVPEDLFVSDDLFDDFLEASASRSISVDVYASSGVIYQESDAQCLSGSFQVGHFDITLYCHDCDAEMENVDADCEDRLSISDAVRAYLMKPFGDLREVAAGCGVTYEPNMSPSDGYPFRVGGIYIESKDELIEYEFDSFPDDKDLIAQLTEAGVNAYHGVSPVDVGHRRPLFSSPPVADESRSYEGVIDAQWECDCFVPSVALVDGDTVWTKVLIDEKWTLSGSDLYGYDIDYEYSFPIELEERLSDDIEGNEDVRREIKYCLMTVLGLARSSMPN